MSVKAGSIVIQIRGGTAKLESDLGKGGQASIGFGRAGAKAQWVEYGHRMIGHEPDEKDLGVVRAHPFMRLAFEDSGEAAIAAFTERLIEMVNMDVIVLDNRSVA